VIAESLFNAALVRGTVLSGMSQSLRAPEYG